MWPAMLRSRRARLVALLTLAVLVAASGTLLWLYQRETVPASARPDVVLGSGSFEGHPWMYGYNLAEDGRPCFKLVYEYHVGGCTTYRGNLTTVQYWTGGGEGRAPTGRRNAQAFVSDEVASIRCVVGGRDVGEAHLFEMPLEGEPRSALCLSTYGELGGRWRDWVIIAYDHEGREIARTPAI
jgi:hypothetical protein